jgi:hypothetical protein
MLVSVRDSEFVDYSSHAEELIKAIAYIHRYHPATGGVAKGKGKMLMNTTSDPLRPTKDIIYCIPPALPYYPLYSFREMSILRYV